MMERKLTKMIRKVLLHLLFPPVAFCVLLAAVGTTLLIYSFAVLKGAGIISYISYALSAYALTVVCVRIPRIIRFFKKIKNENKLLARLSNDAQLRVDISLRFSLAINIAYAVFQLVLGLYHTSLWFCSLAAYYILLVVMRAFLLRDVKNLVSGKNIAAEYRRYRFCGVILLIMNLSLAVIVFYIMWQGRTFSHHEITTIAMAAYTFSSMAVAVMNVMRYKKYDSPIFSAKAAISLAAAVVSMLTLETAMLTAFGSDGEERFRMIMTGCTGGAVCFLVLVMAVYMICHATKEIRRIERRNDNG